MTLALDRLEVEVLATLADASRTEQLREVAAQAALVLTMAGTRLGRAQWPTELDVARVRVGEAFRHLSDALLELQGEHADPGLAEARQSLSWGRAGLQEASSAMPTPN